MTAVSLLTVSCKKNDQVEQIKMSGSVISTQSSGPARVGQPFKIDVTFSLPNSCSSFDSFESWQEKDILLKIKVWALGPRDSDCSNNGVLTNDTKSLTFTFSSPGTHYLLFEQDNGWYRDTITVAP